MLVYLDMDGVCCDFASAALHAHGALPLGERSEKWLWDFWPRGVWSIEEILKMSATEFWRPIEWAGSQFWENLEPYPWFEELKEVLLPHRPIICTSPSRDPECLVGKKRWLQKHGLGGLPVVFTNHKRLLAKPGRVLIDDSEKNCDGFAKEGGETILIPQPWNHSKVAPMPGLVVDSLITLGIDVSK